MKKKLGLVLAGVMIIAGIFAGCGNNQAAEGDNSLKYIQDKGTIVLGLDDSFPPMGFRDESGEIVGFDIDLAKEVAGKLGVKLELQPIDWDAKVLSLNNKDIDLIWNGLTITDERKEKVEFTDPYLANSQIIIVDVDSDIDTKSDLKDKIIGVQLSSSGQDAVTADEDTTASLKELRKYATYPEALLDLKAGRTDAVVIDEVVGRYYISKKPGEYKVATEDFGAEEYGIGFRKGEVELVEEVNKILKEMKEDGTSAEISEKWFGEDIVK